ncbi:hypothetical protein D9M73_138370 [compost metagenome]
MIASTTPDSRRFSPLAKVPLLIAAKPPPILIRPTLIRVRPIISTTIPVTSGVIRRLTNGRMREMPISTNEPAITTPKIAAITPSTGVPCLTINAPPAINGPTKLKLVPCTIKSPAPKGPKRRHCTKVAIPEITSDIDTIRLVSRAETPSAWQISRPGVTIGTMIASRCCNAASIAINGRGRSSRPRTSSLACAGAPGPCSIELMGVLPRKKKGAHSTCNCRLSVGAGLPHDETMAHKKARRSGLSHKLPTT